MNGAKPNFSFDQYRKSSASGSRCGKAPQVFGQARHQCANLRHAGQDPFELVARADRLRSVVVLRHAIGARQIRLNFFEQDLLEPGRRRAPARRARWDRSRARPGDRRGRQPDVAVTDAARADVEVVLVDRERREIVERRRMLNRPICRTSGPLLKRAMSRTRAKNVAFGARMRTAPATATSPGVRDRQIVPHGLAAPQVGDVSVGEPAAGR